MRLNGAASQDGERRMPGQARRRKCELERRTADTRVIVEGARDRQIWRACLGDCAVGRWTSVAIPEASGWAIIVGRTRFAT